MKIVGVIPARYGSSRFPGKPLADICGKPMIWWVYEQAKKVKELSEVYVATDDERIKKVCDDFEIPVVMTSDKHETAFNRLAEFSDKITADAYVIINGDEPLINPSHIKKCINEAIDIEKYVYNTIAPMTSPAEVNDISNIKVIFDDENTALYMSRTAIPFPNKSIDYFYYKHVGITMLTKKQIEFYKQTKVGYLENIESIDHMRFIEHSQKMKFVKLDECKTLSVDTPKDLKVIINTISNKDK